MEEGKWKIKNKKWKMEEGKIGGSTGVPACQ
jgi:hypothetical protein